MNPILSVQEVTVYFGGVCALDNVSFAVQPGEFLSLIGPNGAGKTTLLRSIIGMVRPQAARIFLGERNITALATHRRVRQGVALTHQIVRPLRSLSVLDNVALAAGHRRIRNIFRALVAWDRSAERRRAADLLARVGIAETADGRVSGQPLGVLKRLEVARALALEPKVLLLDEPLAGLNHVEAARLADTLVDINRQGLTVVMIEHNLGEVLRVSRRLVVLDNGRKIAEGDPQQVMRDATVRAAYIGRGDRDAAA